MSICVGIGPVWPYPSFMAKPLTPAAQTLAANTDAEMAANDALWAAERFTSKSAAHTAMRKAGFTFKGFSGGQGGAPRSPACWTLRTGGRWNVVILGARKVARGCWRLAVVAG